MVYFEEIESRYFWPASWIEALVGKNMEKPVGEEGNAQTRGTVASFRDFALRKRRNRPWNLSRKPAKLSRSTCSWDSYSWGSRYS